MKPFVHHNNNHFFSSSGLLRRSRLVLLNETNKLLKDQMIIPNTTRYHKLTHASFFLSQGGYEDQGYGDGEEQWQ